MIEPDPPEPHSLQDIILRLQDACLQNSGAQVSVGDIVHALGPRSFAPIVLAIGLIGVTPIDSIPTLPTTFGVIVFLTVGQMLLGRRSLWLPHLISRRSVSAERLSSALDWLRPYAERADHWLGMRLTMFTHGAFLMVIALSCAVLAALMPLLEFLPLVSTIPSLAFTVFGIALLLHDGVAALIGFALTVLTFSLLFELAKLPF